MRLGIISDTHGLYDEAITRIFAGVDAIIHAGDIGKLDIIHRLETIAPVFAVEVRSIGDYGPRAEELIAANPTSAAPRQRLSGGDLRISERSSAGRELDSTQRTRAAAAI